MNLSNILNRLFSGITMCFVPLMLTGCFSSEPVYNGNVFLGVLDTSNAASEGVSVNYAGDDDTYKNVSVAMWYMDWEQPFPKQKVDALLAERKISHIVWEPWVWGDPEGLKLKHIFNGDWDEHIKEWAKAIAGFQYPIFIRFAPNFNVQDVPWSVFQNYKRGSHYKRAYQHVVDIFKKEGAMNAIWVWSFMTEDKPSSEWNNVQKAYPGDDYVDWIGVNGFNYGDVNGNTWTDFETIFSDRLKEVGRLYPNKPIMISEFGTVKNGGDKSEWIKQVPRVLQSSFPEVKCLIYKDSIEGPYNWSIGSTPSGKLAFNTISALDIFSANIDDINSITPYSWEPLSANVLSKEIDIDGYYSDWNLNETKSLPMNKIGQVRDNVKNWNGKRDFGASVALAHENDNIYIYLNVDDDNIVTKNAEWRKNDRVVIYFSNERGKSHTIKSLVLPLNKPLFHVSNGKNVSKSLVESKLSQTKWEAELKVPINSLGFPFPTSKSLHINIGYIDVDGEGAQSSSSAHVLHGNKQFFQHTPAWPKIYQK